MEEADRLIQVRVVAPSDLIQGLRDEVVGRMGNESLLDHGTVDHPTSLDFDYSHVATVVGLVNASLLLGRFAKIIYGWLAKNPGKRILIQTPLRRVELVSTIGLEEEEIKRKLRVLVRAVE